MSYRTINPFTEELVKTFPEHSDAEMQAILTQADDTFRKHWSQRLPRKPGPLGQVCFIVSSRCDAALLRHRTLDPRRLFVLLPHAI